MFRLTRWTSLSCDFKFTQSMLVINLTQSWKLWPRGTWWGLVIVPSESFHPFPINPLFRRMNYQSFVSNRFQEKKLSLSEIVPYLCRVKQNSSSNGTAESPVLNTSTHHYSRSESRSASVGQSETHRISITFLVDEKMSTNNKRRYENQVPTTLLAIFFRNSIYHENVK